MERVGEFAFVVIVDCLMGFVEALVVFAVVVWHGGSFRSDAADWVCLGGNCCHLGEFLL